MYPIPDYSLLNTYPRDPGSEGKFQERHCCSVQWIFYRMVMR